MSANTGNEELWGWRGRPSGERGMLAGPLGVCFLLALFAAVVFTGCLGANIEYVPPAPPVISGVPTKVDTVGKPLSYGIVVSVEGGSVKSFSVAPPLPAGVSLDTLTGVISGIPLVSWPPTLHIVTASGFGGTDTAGITIRIAQIKPNITYVTPVVDTQFRQASHPVISTGGGENVFTVSPSLPSGLHLDTATGLISGAPFSSAPSTVYRVIAVNSAGRDTAFITLSVVENATLPDDATGVMVSANIGFASGIPLTKLIMTLTPSAPGGGVIRDTVMAGTQGFVSSPGSAQTFGKFLPLTVGQGYVLEVKTLDNKDSVIHRGEVVIPALAAASVHVASLAMPARFAALTLQTGLYTNASEFNPTFNVPLTYTRAVFLAAGDTVYDTTAAGGTFPTTGSRQFSARYIPADKIQQVVVLIFGSASGWNSTLPIIRIDFLGPYVPGTVLYVPSIQYVGPGSPDDPNLPPE